MRFASRCVNLVLLIAIPAGVFAAAPAQDSSAGAASEYPNKPLRLIVPWVAGGGTDIMARIIAQKLSDNLGQRVVVDPRPGANGIIGSEIAAKATPDGHTLVLHAIEHVINASTRSKLPYDTLRDFAPVTKVGTQPLLLVVSPSMPVSSVKELIALAKAKPKELTFGSVGDGSLAHLTGELMKGLAGIDMLHITYKGAPQAMIDIIGGRLALSFTGIGIPYVQSGKLKALAVTGPKRLALVPDVPTMSEAGYAGIEAESWRAIYAPGATPRRFITRLNRELVKVLQMPDVREQLTATGFDAVSSTPEQLDAFTRAELAKWARVVKSAGVRIE